MAKAMPTAIWSWKGCLYIFGGLFLAVTLVLEVSKWEVHVTGEGIELVRRASSRAAQTPSIGATLAQSLAAVTGRQSEPVKKRAPRVRRKYSLPWSAEPEAPVEDSGFHAGIRSSRIIEEELGSGFQPKLGLENGTLTWSAEAEDFLLNVVLERQFPADCGAEKWLVIDPHRHGLGSSTHTYVLTLLMSLSLNRTLVINEEPPDPRQDGCVPASITTLFEPHTHCSFATNPEKRAAYQMPQAAMDWRQILNPEEDLEELDVIRLTDTVPRPRGWSWERWERWQAEGWWERLWEQLVDSGSVSVVGDGPFSEVSMQTQQMMLWANVLNWMWRPTKRVQRISRTILCNHEAQKPLVSVHIRRTDKEVEDPYWREHHEYRPLTDYGAAVAEYAEATGSDVRTVFVFSDSAKLMKELPNTGLGMLGLNDKSAELIVDDFLDLSPIEANWSHERLGCEQKNQIVEHLVAAMEVALENSEYIVMTMGSSVGRIMAEVMAGRRRIAYPQPASPFTKSLDVDWFYDW